MARSESLVQLTDEMRRTLDERAAREGRSRSALIRDAITSYLRDEREAEIDRAIVAGYMRLPQTPQEQALAHANAVRGPVTPW